MDIAGISPRDGAELIRMLRLYQAGKLFPQERTRDDFRIVPDPWYVYNTTTETIPPFGVMQVTSATREVSGRIYHDVVKPFSYDFRNGAFLFNGSQAIPPKHYGAGNAGPVTRAAKIFTAQTNSNLRYRPRLGYWLVEESNVGQWTFAGNDTIAFTDPQYTIVRLFVHPPVLADLVHCRTPSSGIGAKVGDVMDAEYCTAQTCSTQGALSTSNAGDQILVFNPTSTAIAGSTDIVAAKNASGIYICIVEDCG